MLNPRIRNLESNIHLIRRRYFTIVEMLIVITILVIFSGVIGINIAKALREQQFNTEVGLIVERLRLAQNLMLVANRDVKVIVRGLQKNEGLELSLDVEGGVAEEWQFMIDRSRVVLTTIHKFDFEDLLAYPTIPNEIEIKFLSGGTVMSKGVIHLSTHEKGNDSGAMKSAIILYGYPHPIVSVAEGQEPVVFVDEDHNYDLRLTAYTVEELKQYQEMQKTQNPAEQNNNSDEGEGSVPKNKAP